MGKCAVLYCKNYSGHTRNVSYHAFPVDPNRRRKWIDAVRRQNTWIPTKNHCICSIHFAEECYNANSTKQRKLHKDSIPTLNLPKFGRQRNKDSSPEESEPELESEPTLELKIEPTDEQRPQCATCHEVILGFVFACVECNARSCSACDARGLHAAHLVLRAPVARPESQLKLVLNKIRDTLGPVIEGTPRTIPDQPVEELPQEPDEEPLQDPKEKYIIKMEIEMEEHAPFWHESASGAPANTDEETIVPDVEHQSMSWAGRDTGEEQSDSCTITASTSSEHSSRVKRVSSDKSNEKYPKANKRARRAVKKEPSDQKRPVLKKGSSDQKCLVVKKGSSDQKCPVVKKGSCDQKCPVVKKKSSDQKCPEQSSGSAAQGISHSRQQTRKRRGSRPRLPKTEDIEDCIKAHTIDIPPE
ncbi:uncharacterized protein LOC135084285 isoform X7 [Ostrinia nubilalis]|uniref:uncharacterized protein LOC135084285 isoform X7 n=1 Tax=Ostrinia nubilalis TaxID=29057 RepID=UPI0030823B7A